MNGCWHNLLPTSLDAPRRLQCKTAAQLDARLPTLLDKSFEGQL